MAEPHTSAAGLTLSLSLGVTGTILGAEADGFIVALAGSLLVAFWLSDIDSFWRAAAAVLFCMLLGGFLSPLTADLVAMNYPGVTNDRGLRISMALAIGPCSLFLFPVALKFARRYAEKKASNGEGTTP